MLQKGELALKSNQPVVENVYAAVDAEIVVSIQTHASQYGPKVQLWMGWNDSMGNMGLWEWRPPTHS